MSTPNPEPWLECREVTRTFGTGATRPGVQAITCRLGPGARVALVGPSGSGKSTLIHLIAGLDTPTSGTITWPRLGRAPRPGDVGVVFQGPSLVPELTVSENVALPILFAGGAARPDEVTGALERVGLAELADKLPDQISGGQAQRVAAARILLGGPGIVLADEPTGQLDQASGQAVVSALMETADELDAALVIATHDREVAARLDHRWTLRDGRLESCVATTARDAAVPVETADGGGTPG